MSDAGPGVLHAAALVLFFQSYSVVRARVAGSPSISFAHARLVMRLERSLHLPAERQLQALIIEHPAWCQAANMYYGSVHFVVPAAAFVVLYRQARYRYRHALQAFVTINVVAVVVFAVWPLMPPRLLPAGYGYIDVGARFPGLPLDRALASGPGNGFAAMPSLHAAYAVWTVWALWPFVRGRLRALALAYPRQRRHHRTGGVAASAVPAADASEPATATLSVHRGSVAMSR